MNQSLILLRHSQRQGTNDSLTEFGKKQSEDRGVFLYQSCGAEMKVLTSPKNRCLQSLEKWIALSQKTPLVIEELSERFDFEDTRAFEKRVQGVLETSLLHSAPLVTLICSHSDWLFVAAKHLLDLQIQFLEGSWAHLMRYQNQRNQNHWILKDFISSEEDFQIMKNQWRP